jgi:probable rRNA maturation factor
MSPGENPLLFQRARRRLPRRGLREFAERLRQTVAGGRQFFCLLTDDRELRRLNREFRGKDYTTDVLAFPQCGAGPPSRSRPPGRLSSSLGEIAISTERAAAQARAYGHGLEAEVEILMLHGLLHLLGMDHEKDAGRMLRAEARWRKKLALPQGLTERVRA